MEKGISALNELVYASVIHIGLYYSVKFDMKLKISGEGNREKIFNEEFELISDKIQFHFLKFEELIDEYLHYTNSMINNSDKEYSTVDGIIDGCLGYFVNWTNEGYLDEKGIKEFISTEEIWESLERLSVFDPISSVVPLDGLDDVIDVLVWLSYYFEVFIRKNYREYNLPDNNQKPHGFKSTFGEEQISALYKLLLDKYIHKDTKLSNFKVVFQDKPISTSTLS